MTGIKIYPIMFHIYLHMFGQTVHKEDELIRWRKFPFV